MTLFTVEKPFVADLINVGLVVVRYFGDIKLGTGGLARDYSSAAKAAIEAADLTPWHRIIRQSITASFETSSAIKKQISNLNLPVINRIFNEIGVILIVEGPEEKILSLSL